MSVATAGNPSTLWLIVAMVLVRVLTSALPSTYPTPTANAVPTAKINPVTHPDEEEEEESDLPPRRLFGADMTTWEAATGVRRRKPLRVPVTLLLL